MLGAVLYGGATWEALKQKGYLPSEDPHSGGKDT